MKSAPSPTRTEINDVLSGIKDRITRNLWDGKIAWRRYGALIEGNFVHWLLSAHLRSSCQPTKDTLLANLRDEVVDDHPGLLRSLLCRNNLLPSESDQVHVSEFMAWIRTLCASGEPGVLLTFLAILESTSHCFLPTMAIRAGFSTEDPYIKVHLEADQDHAAQLQTALQREYDLGIVPFQAIDQGIELVYSFFDILFE